MTRKKNAARTVQTRGDEPEDSIRHAVHSEFYESIAEVLHATRSKVYRAVNFAMVEAYWNIGRMIVEEEQQGKERAEYGTFIIRNLSVRLRDKFGQGFSEQTLWNIRQFFLAFPILSALRRELRWTHYKMLMRVENDNARSWYLTEAADRNWSTRALERQINSLYYERLVMSGDKDPARKEAHDTVANNPEGFQPLAGGKIRR
jgi:hypothetical protein